MPRTEERAEPEYKARGIDRLLVGYSRWKTRRLVAMDATPLSALALQTLYLSGCILADGVLLPWIVTLLDGDFSFLLFALLLIPALALEAVGYRRLKASPQQQG